MIRGWGNSPLEFTPLLVFLELVLARKCLWISAHYTFGSEPQQINYRQRRKFKEPELDLIGGSVQGSWNAMCCDWTANDCHKQLSDWLWFLVNSTVDWPTLWLRTSGIASRREYTVFPSTLLLLGLIQTGVLTKICKWNPET